MNENKQISSHASCFTVQCGRTFAGSATVTVHLPIETDVGWLWVFEFDPFRWENRGGFTYTDQRPFEVLPPEQKKKKKRTFVVSGGRGGGGSSEPPTPCVRACGAKFRGEARVAVLLIPRCGFPVVCYSQRVFNIFKSSVTAQEELVRTQRLPFASIRGLLDLLLASRSHLCPAHPAPGAACTAHASAAVDVRGKSSNAVWPGLEAYSRWSPFSSSFRALVS